MLGVVIAGGESRRMGRDKALVELGGAPLWRRQVDVLQAAGAERVVLVRRRAQEPIDYADCCFDAFEGCGPLAGIHAALEVVGHDLVAVLAVDMPGIDPDWFRWLKEFCRPGVGAVAGHAPHLEPLAAIYPAEARSEVSERLARRELSVSGLALGLAAAGKMKIVGLPAQFAGKVASLNAPPA